MPRYSREDTETHHLAKQILRNPNATADEKAQARKTIEQLRINRNRRLESRQSAGQQPQRKQFQTDADYKTALQQYWEKLDRAVAEREALKVLNNPTTSSLVRARAYERLGLTPPPALARDDSDSGSDVKKQEPINVAKHAYSDAEIAEERRREQKFYDEIAEMLAEEKQKENSHERKFEPVSAQ
jgi:hypothetical protein